MAGRTPTYRLADNLLDGDLEHIVTEHRADGRSWRWIARDLYDRTGHVVDVTHETLRSWFPDLPSRGAA